MLQKNSESLLKYCRAVPELPNGILAPFFFPTGWLYSVGNVWWQMTRVGGDTRKAEAWMHHHRGL